MDKIFGRNAVLEAIKSGNRTINKILVSKTAHGSSISEIIKLAKMKGIVINNVPPEKLDKFEQESTQGVVAEVSATNYWSIKYEHNNNHLYDYKQDAESTALTLFAGYKFNI